MTETIKIGKRLIPLEHITLLEPFNAEELTRIKTERQLKTRVVLLNRDSVLTEQPLESFAAAHGFRILVDEGIATNPMVAFSVEAFSPTDFFEPAKPYRSRLMWKDQAGQNQSKLLLIDPEKALAVIVRGEPESPSERKPNARRPRRTRKPSSSPSPA